MKRAGDDYRAMTGQELADRLDVAARTGEPMEPAFVAEIQNRLTAARDVYPSADDCDARAAIGRKLAARMARRTK